MDGRTNDRTHERKADMIAESRKKESNRQVARLRGSPATLSVGYGILAICSGMISCHLSSPLLASLCLARTTAGTSPSLFLSHGIVDRQNRQKDRQKDKQTRCDRPSPLHFLAGMFRLEKNEKKNKRTRSRIRTSGRVIGGGGARESLRLQP